MMVTGSASPPVTITRRSAGGDGQQNRLAGWHARRVAAAECTYCGADHRFRTFAAPLMPRADQRAVMVAAEPVRLSSATATSGTISALVPGHGAVMYRVH